MSTARPIYFHALVCKTDGEPCGYDSVHKADSRFQLVLNTQKRKRRHPCSEQRGVIVHLTFLPPFCQRGNREGCTCFPFIAGTWRKETVNHQAVFKCANLKFQKWCLLILSTPCVYKAAISLAPRYATCSNTGLNKFSDLHSLRIVGRKMA